MKEFLSHHNVPYTDRDISVDDQALEELEKLGFMTTPVVTVDGEIVVGFNQKRLKELLNV